MNLASRLIGRSFSLFGLVCLVLAPRLAQAQVELDQPSSLFPPQSEWTHRLLFPDQLAEVFHRPAEDPIRIRFEEQLESFAKPLLSSLAEADAQMVGESQSSPVFQLEDFVATWDASYRERFFGPDFDFFALEDKWSRPVSEPSSNWTAQEKSLVLHAAFQELLNDAALSTSLPQQLWHERILEHIEEDPARVAAFARVSSPYMAMLLPEVEARLDGLREDIEAYEGMGPSPRLQSLFRSLQARPHLFADSGFSFARFRDFVLDEGEEASLEELAFLKVAFAVEAVDSPQFQDSQKRAFGAESVLESSQSGRYGALDASDKEVLSESRLVLAHEEYEKKSRAKANSIQTWGITMGTPLGLLSSGLLLRRLTRAQGFDWGFARDRARVFKDIQKSKPQSASRAQIQSLLDEKSNSKYRQRLRREFPGAREDFKQQMNFIREQDRKHERAVQQAQKFFGEDLAQKFDAFLKEQYAAAEGALDEIQGRCAAELLAASKGGAKMLRARAQIQRAFIDRGGRQVELPDLQSASSGFLRQELSPNLWQRYRPRSRFRRLASRAGQIDGKTARPWFKPWVRNPQLPAHGQWSSMVPGEALGHGLLSSATRGLGRTLSSTWSVGLTFAAGGVGQYYQSVLKSHQLPAGQEFSSTDPLWLEIRSEQPQLAEVLEASTKNLVAEWQGAEGEETEIEFQINQARASQGLGPIDLVVDPRASLLGSNGEANQNTGRVSSLFVWMLPRIPGDQSKDIDAQAERIKGSWLIVMNSYWEDETQSDASQAGEVSWSYAAKAPLYKAGNERYNRKALEVFSSTRSYPDPEAAKRLFNPLDFLID